MKSSFCQPLFGENDWWKVAPWWSAKIMLCRSPLEIPATFLHANPTFSNIPASVDLPYTSTIIHRRLFLQINHFRIGSSEPYARSLPSTMLGLGCLGYVLACHLGRRVKHRILVRLPETSIIDVALYWYRHVQTWSVDDRLKIGAQKVG